MNNDCEIRLNTLERHVRSLWSGILILAIIVVILGSFTFKLNNDVAFIMEQLTYLQKSLVITNEVVIRLLAHMIMR